MAKNIITKILLAHLREGSLESDGEIGLRIDQTITQDATGTMAYLQFEAMGLEEIKTDLSVSYVDHNTVQVGFENADDQKYLQTVAAKYGIVFSRPGNGICHQAHLERFGKPGTTLLGSDSHTPTGGGICQVAMGAGGLDVAVAMGGGLFYTVAPKIYLVNLTGKLAPWVSAKDIVLKMLEILGTKGNVGVMLEYGGPGVENLSVPQRATIANMGAEMGVTCSVFPSDNITKKFLKAQNREADWSEIKADPGAKYAEIIDLDLSLLEPMVACPHSPGNVKKISEIEGKTVDQVCIGSCTNSSYKDMKTVAEILKGRKVNPALSLGIAPGSRQVLQMLARDGALSALLDSGARILESACGFCIGNHFSPKSGGVSIRTSNRNFEGRSGTADAQLYLTGPEAAAVAAITGKFADPRKFGMKYPSIKEPESFLTDDSMFIKSSPKMKNEIFRGPNIGEPPKNDKMTEKLNGAVMIVVGDKITTDHIMPAGARLKYRSNIPKYARYVFENLDGSFAKRCLESKAGGFHNIIVAGESYGQGSSREHAALCPMYLGVKAVLAKSFERIHAANLLNFGIAPLLFKNPADYASIKAGDKLTCANWRAAITEGKPIILINKRSGDSMECVCRLSSRQTDILKAGGLLNHTIRQTNS